jgi:hypothetical protein
MNCWERCFLCGPCRGYITRRSCDYERVLRWHLEEQEVCVRRPPVCEDMSLGTGERPLVKTADWESLVHAVVNCKMCELAIALQLLVVTICKCSINTITNPNPVYSHSITWQHCSSIPLNIRRTYIVSNKRCRFPLYIHMSRRVFFLWGKSAFRKLIKFYLRITKNLVILRLNE